MGPIFWITHNFSMWSSTRRKYLIF